jgi:uncharacterized membrane protein YedE/YeeE
MRPPFALAVGLLFGAGLCLSGMTQPSKVLGFLDITGTWDPSLADRKSTRLNSSHNPASRMPSSA